MECASPVDGRHRSLRRPRVEAGKGEDERDGEAKILKRMMTCFKCKLMATHPAHFTSEGAICNSCRSITPVPRKRSERPVPLACVSVELLPFKVPCQNPGCSKSVEYAYLQAHMLNCYHAKLECRFSGTHNCQWKGNLETVEEHFTDMKNSACARAFIHLSCDPSPCGKLSRSKTSFFLMGTITADGRGKLPLLNRTADGDVTPTIWMFFIQENNSNSFILVVHLKRNTTMTFETFLLGTEEECKPCVVHITWRGRDKSLRHQMTPLPFSQFHNPYVSAGVGRPAAVGFDDGAVQAMLKEGDGKQIEFDVSLYRKTRDEPGPEVSAQEEVRNGKTPQSTCGRQLPPVPAFHS